MNLILASGSPRRRELLSLYTSDFAVCVSDFDESAVTAPPRHAGGRAGAGQMFGRFGPAPRGGGHRLRHGGGRERRGLRQAPQPRRCQADAPGLSGATHEVHTGVCISDGERTESFVDTCRVKFFSIPEAEIERYAATEEPYDKAGAYAIQGRAALWLDAIEGDYYTIMGLPVSRTIRLLQQF